jgi:4-hydroxy-2-oxoheptanedioate aldolase
MEINKLKQKLLDGKTVYGPFCKLQDPSVVEIAALASFDFVILDMEHGPLSVESVQSIARAAQAKGIEVVVRVTENRTSDILRILDVGVNSIQVPQVNSVADAQKVVDASFFYPKGERGMCRYVRAASYTGIEKKEYFSSANLGTLTIIHIEGNKGLENLEQIVSLDGIDIVFLGPYDLSQSCGYPGQTNHPEVVNKMKEAVMLAKANNKIIGTFCESPSDAHKWRDLGVQYISYSVDVGIILNAYKEITKQLKN